MTGQQRVSMKATVQIACWGNSLAVRLPAAVVEALELEEGDQVEIRVVDVRRLEIDGTPDARQLLQALRCYRGRLPADFRFNRQEV
jgi:antitoxin MazE